MSIDQAIGVLVIPYRKSALFWPFICQNGSFVKEIIHWFDLPTEKHNYIRCKNGKGMFGNTDLNFRMLAIMLSFKQGK